MVDFRKFVKRKVEARREEKEIEQEAFKRKFVPARKKFLEQRGEARAKAKAASVGFRETISGGVREGVRKGAPVFGRGLLNLAKAAAPKPSKVRVVDKSNILEVRVVSGKKKKRKTMFVEEVKKKEPPRQEQNPFDVGNIRLI
ncbi:hypothetical protein LCGC14_0484940 [marine sediment metagenome]|uniref:Uncharacterized protein n=1 Tax=marine sediment metagenome TaxID=412755 RepID=A0A0F9UVB7_9ZZZZ